MNETGNYAPNDFQACRYTAGSDAGGHDMHITIDGFSGGMTPPNTNDAIAFALTLLLEGYCIRVNGIRVHVEYGPGYNTVIWSEGDYEGRALDALAL